jgi:hypothetical protein
MPQPPPKAKLGARGRLEAALIGFGTGDAREAIKFGQGVENKPIADWDEKNARDAAAAKTQLDARNTESEIALRGAETQKALNPPAKTKPIVIADENGNPTPAIQDEESGQVTDANGTPVPLPKMWEKPASPKAQTDEDKKISDEIVAKPALYPGGDIASNRAKARLAVKTAESAAGRDNTTKDTARLDRSYTFNAKELDNERKPLEATMAKISAATSNIDLKSPQADALLAPQILSLSAGGVGSGLRMNEAEIARILGGRTVWESLKASMNKWSTDPNHPAIPDAQRAQMVQILEAAKQKGTLKSSIMEWADNALVNSDDVKDHRQIVATARKLLNAVDEGKRIQRNKTTGEFRIAAGE